MRELLTDLMTTLHQVCPTFLQVKPHTAYPYVTIEPQQMLQGFPRGPCIVTLVIKISSRYAGTREILKLAQRIESLLQGYSPPTFKVSLKVLKSSLVLLADGQTRIHTFLVKARLKGEHQ